MKKLLSVVLLGALWLSVSAFEWTNAGGDPYTGTRQAAIARSGFPSEVQATFLKMIEEDKANEAANRTEGINYTTDVIPKDYAFDWTMFGRDKRETGVFARTSHWNQSVDRRARVYRVHVRNGVEGGTESFGQDAGHTVLRLSAGDEGLPGEDLESGPAPAWEPAPACAVTGFGLASIWRLATGR